ncbi:FemAB family PEP-CTERM system-associated protein [Marinobacter sp. Z-F4-2]|nr:FemAB family PEP-CTERM system-associated protein [Marinobacter sp. Z-F4-2]
MTDLGVIDFKERENWNRFVSNAKSGTPYHRFEWLEAIQSSYGHKPYPIAARQEGMIVAVLPLIMMEQPLTGKKTLVSLPFCDLGGPIGERRECELLAKKALELAESIGVRELEVRQRGGQGLGFDFETLASELGNRKVSMILEVEAGSEKQLAAFKPKLRSQIKKAMKNGCTTELGNNEKLVEDFYHVFSRNMHALGSPVHSKDLFHAICGAFGDQAVVAVTYFQGEVAAGGIVLKNGQNAAIPWASSLSEYNRLAPNMLLYWELLSHCADNGIRVFDFGRSTFGEGTFRFKKQWGAQPYLLSWQNWMDSSESGAGAPGKIRPLLENAWRRLPLSLVNVLGPLVRKHIRL